MGKAWVKGRKRDPYYRRAKSQGYRSRAAFKLMQIDARFNLIYEGDAVLDLGAAPGGWSQVAKVLVGDAGRVVAADLVGMRPLAGVDVWKGDLTDPEFIETLAREVGVIDVVISDMSPRLSGNKTLDHERSLALAETALGVAVGVLRPGGHFLAKVFQGPGVEAFKDLVAARFETAKGHAPEASRKESREFYVVGKGFRRTPTRPRPGPARA